LNRVCFCSVRVRRSFFIALGLPATKKIKE